MSRICRSSPRAVVHTPGLNTRRSVGRGRGMNASKSSPPVQSSAAMVILLYSVVVEELGIPHGRRLRFVRELAQRLDDRGADVVRALAGDFLGQHQAGA